MHLSSVICACARRLFKNIDNMRSADSRIHVVCFPNRHDRRGAPLICLALFDYLVCVAVTITEHGGEVKVMMLH